MAREPFFKSATFGMPNISLVPPGQGHPSGQADTGLSIGGLEIYTAIEPNTLTGLPPRAASVGAQAAIRQMIQRYLPGLSFARSQ